MDRYVQQLATEAGQCDRATRPIHAIFTHLHCLEAVFEKVPLDTLLSLTLVSKLFHHVANDVIWRHELTPSPRLITALNANPRLRHLIRSVHLPKSALTLLLDLPDLCPRLKSLTIGSDTHVTASVLADTLCRLASLEELSLVGLDWRGRRRRSEDSEPEGEASKALAILSYDEAPLSMLRRLSIKSTPLKLGTLKRFLEVHGARLESLDLEGCSVGYLAIDFVEQHCPRLRHLRLDAYMTTTGPPSTPRPNAPPPDFDRAVPLSFSSRLTSLHLSSLPTLNADAFALFGDENTGGALRSLSVSHCDISAVHLSHFAFVTKLRLVSTPNVQSIPVFPDQSHPDVGTGMKQLRQVSMLGCHGITLGNVWELMQLGREEDDSLADDKARRKRLGLGSRGVQKLTIDGTGARGSRFRVSGVELSLPRGLGARPAGPDLESGLQELLSPPSHLGPYIGMNVLSPSIPAAALLAVIVSGQDLEHFALYGTAPAFSNPLDMIALDRKDHGVSRSAFLISKLKVLLASFPLAAWYFPPRPPRNILPEPLKLDECYIGADDWTPAPSRRVNGRAQAGSLKDAASGGGNMASGGQRLTSAQVRWVKEAGSGKLTSLRV